MIRAILVILVILALVGAGLAIIPAIGANVHAANIAEAHAYGEMAQALQVQALAGILSQFLMCGFMIVGLVAGAGLALAYVRANRARAEAITRQPVTRQALTSQTARAALADSALVVNNDIGNEELFYALLNWRR